MADDVDEYTPPIFARLEPMGEPLPPLEVACTSCPISLWYWSGNDSLTCFCSALHRETWVDGRAVPKPIRFCDGREQALARLATDRDLNNGR